MGFAVGVDVGVPLGIAVGDVCVCLLGVGLANCEVATADGLGLAAGELVHPETETTNNAIIKMLASTAVTRLLCFIL